MSFSVVLSREPEDVIISRGGSVLGKKTILKSDHFPGCQNKRLLPHVEGAPNYRQVGSLPVYGVAIPTVAGIRHVLDLVGCSRVGGRSVLWHNMREEPVIYINGRPFVLREVERPFTNLEYTGIDRARVEQMEMRLKEDVLQEASRYSNKIMVSDELPDGQMVDQWEPIGPGSVQTPLEVYENLQAEGYNVRYERVPVTDEKSPKERDFDLLVQNLSQLDTGAAQVFNCQMGRGRTTTGMVVATLLYLRRTSPEMGGLLRTGSGMVPSTEKEIGVVDSEEALRRGEYAVIRSLTRVLEGGVENKRQVDLVIDQCSDMQNLREAILTYRNSIHRQADEKKRQAALSNFVEYLERYYFLICFAVYLHTDPRAIVPRSHEGETNFQFWMRDRPELYSVLRRLLRRDPMGSLGYAPITVGKIRRPSAGSPKRPDMASVVTAREGEVLGRQTCLKSDHCPGCQSFNLPETVEGAPNFREVTGFPVYGVANPTVEGIRAVLARVGGSPGGRKVVWHNMREEPTVYISGKPFVLREVERPFKNMLEYTGIDKARVENMEARLKEDVLREAERYDGAIMVNDETADGEVFDSWEQVLADGSSVRTPLEVYESLQGEGYDVHYARLPMTDGKAPKSRDFDSLAQNIANAGPDTCFVFNCQMGRGRTTTGTVIATLVLTRCIYGRPLRLPPVVRLTTYPDSGSSSDGDSPTVEKTTIRNSRPPLAPKGNGSDIEGRSKLRPSGLSGLDLVDESIAKGQLVSRFNQVSSNISSADSLSACLISSAENLDELTRNHIGSNEGLEILRRYASGSFGAGDKFFPNMLSEDASANSKDTQMVEKDSVEQVVVSRKDHCPEVAVFPNSLERKISIMKFKMEDIAIIRKIMRLLERGTEVRKVLDAVIDRCAAMQNIRRAILRYRRAFNNQDEDARVRQSALSRGVEYLERYYMLIAFAAYLESDAFVPDQLWCSDRINNVSKGRGTSFKAWIRKRPEIRQLKWGMRLRPARVFTIPEVDFKAPHEREEGDAVQEAVVRSRFGSVLGRSTILKLNMFPGLKSGNDSHYVRGAPNVREIDGFPVHSMATPTVNGAKAVITDIGAGPSSEKTSLRTAIVTDLREEAVVYIKGKPYVLREVDQPVSTLKNVGIEGPAVEQLEKRLKEDILEEASKMGGKILLHREQDCPNIDEGEPNIVGIWQFIEPEDVLTPAEVYASLLNEGFSIDYRRIPLTRERSPKTGDIDAIQRRLDRPPKNPVFLFISHTGYGGIAYAMAITCLRLHAEAQVLGASSSTLPTSPGFSELSTSPSTPPGRFLPAPMASPLLGIKTPYTVVGSPPSPRTSVRGFYPPSPRLRLQDNAKPSASKKGSLETNQAAWRRREYRDVLSLERVLVHGPASRFETDAIIDRLAGAGNLREDILQHKNAMEACGETDDDRETRAAEGDRALKALRRYCFLILFRAYLFAREAEKGSLHAGDLAFSAWMGARPELGHMVDRLKLA